LAENQQAKPAAWFSWSGYKRRKIPMSHSWEKITLPFPWVTHSWERIMSLTSWVTFSWHNCYLSATALLL